MNTTCVDVCVCMYVQLFFFINYPNDFLEYWNSKVGKENLKPAQTYSSVV